MNKCIKCNVLIADNTDKCPLCQHVISNMDGINEEDQDKYPNVRDASRKVRLFENIVLFLSIVTTVVLCFIDYLMDNEINWSIIVFLVLIYANVTLRLAIIGKSGYIFKTISTFVFTVVLLFGIDLLTGDKGWALTFVFPGAIIAMAAGTLLLMAINHRNWQSYMMVQIFLVLMSIIAVVLLGLGIITFPYVALAALGASSFLFLGTLIIGDARARTELKRRFHV